MSCDYSQPGDPYGVSEYTAQSSGDGSSPLCDPSLDVRGNEVVRPRGLPTQEEADAIKGVA